MNCIIGPVGQKILHDYFDQSQSLEMLNNSLVDTDWLVYGLKTKINTAGMNAELDTPDSNTDEAEISHIEHLVLGLETTWELLVL